MGQRLQVKRQIGRRHRQRAGNFTGDQTLRPDFDQQPVDIQTHAGGERFKNGKG
jgi:hypothetical protein